MFKFKTEDGLDYMVPDFLHKCQISWWLMTIGDNWTSNEDALHVKTITNGMRYITWLTHYTCYMTFNGR
jgi:hypothetical protein